MKKPIIALVITFLISIGFIYGITGNSGFYKHHKQIMTLLEQSSKEYDHEFIIATKEIKQRLYGKWNAVDGPGYSMKYDVTGGAFDDGKLDISKKNFCIFTIGPILKNVNGQTVVTGHEYYATAYKDPVFAYYQETMEQMRQDAFLDYYTGIDDVSLDVVGTIVMAMGIPPDSPDKYEFIAPIFIIIDDYVIAVNQSTFYKLEKADHDESLSGCY